MTSETTKINDTNENRTFIIEGTEIKESDLSDQQKYLISIISRIQGQIGELAPALDEKKLALDAAMGKLKETIQKESIETS